MSIKGQVILINVFTLTFALFSVLMLLTSVSDKFLKIKNMENVYQAIANSEKGLEVALLYIFKKKNLYLNITTSNVQTNDCGGIKHNNRIGNCIQRTYQPIIGSQWKREEKFIANEYIFITRDNEGNFEISQKLIVDGYGGKDIKSLIAGSIR